MREMKWISFPLPFACAVCALGEFSSHTFVTEGWIPTHPSSFPLFRFSFDLDMSDARLCGRRRLASHQWNEDVLRGCDSRRLDCEKTLIFSPSNNQTVLSQRPVSMSCNIWITPVTLTSRDA